MWKWKSGGFALLEVVVAVGLLSVSTLVIAQTLGAALEYARIAEAMRQAAAVAAAVATTYEARADYPAGWRVAGEAGPDGIPGTRDDGPPDRSGTPCWRRISTTDSAVGAWLWVEVTCGGEHPDNSSEPRRALTMVRLR